MKMHALMENKTSELELTVEHGVSLLMETKQHKILLDTGQMSALVRNTENNR